MKRVAPRYKLHLHFEWDVCTYNTKIMYFKHHRPGAAPLHFLMDGERERERADGVHVLLMQTVRRRDMASTDGAWLSARGVGERITCSPVSQI